MRIVIIQKDGVVGVDGVFRKVDLSEIAGEIHAIQFNTAPSAGGLIEFDRGVTVAREVRDHEAEDAAWAAARAARTPEREIDVPVMMKMVNVPREPEFFTDFAPYQVYLERWNAAAPPSPTAEQLRAQARTQIDAQRETALRVGVDWNGKRWHTDPTFQFHLSARLQAWDSGLLAPEATAPVRAMDDSINQLGRTEHLQLAGAVMVYVQQVWADSWAAKDAL